MVNYKPTADYCWEGRLVVTVVLMVLLWLFTALRFKALRGISYPCFSPRGIAGGCIVGVTAIMTVYGAMVIWNYTVWYNIRGLHEQSWKTRDDELLVELRSMIPGEEKRKLVSFWSRMMLVTVLWLVKFSFILIFYEFKEQLPKRTRFYLYFTTGSLAASYFVVWIVTVADLHSALEREKYSPGAGAGVTLLTPLTRWSDFLPRKSFGNLSTLFLAELVITTLNLSTDILLLITVILIFQYLSLSRHRGQFRAASLMTTLFAITITIAIVRLGVLLAGMKPIYNRLAFDSLTDVEAYISGMAASMPAVRALARSAEIDKHVIEFVDSWSRTGSRSRKSIANLARRSFVWTGAAELGDENHQKGGKKGCTTTTTSTTTTTTTVNTTTVTCSASAGSVRWEAMGDEEEQKRRSTAALLAGSEAWGGVTKINEVMVVSESQEEIEMKKVGRWGGWK